MEAGFRSRPGFEEFLAEPPVSAAQRLAELACREYPRIVLGRLLDRGHVIARHLNHEIRARELVGGAEAPDRGRHIEEGDRPLTAGSKMEVEILAGLDQGFIETSDGIDPFPGEEDGRCVNQIPWIMVGYRSPDHRDTASDPGGVTDVASITSVSRISRYLR